MGNEQYNPMQHVEVREKVGIAGLYIETLQPGARLDSAAADIERIVIAAIHAAAKPLLADASNLRDQMEATRAAAVRERDRMRGNVDAATARAEAAEQRAEALAAEVARLRADALLLAGLANHRAVYEMDGHDAEALDVAAERADEAADGVVIDVIRRALWGVAEAQPAEVADG